MTYRSILIPLCTAVVAACSDAGPSAAILQPATYELRAVGGRPLPLVVRVISPSRSITLIEGALTLRPDGTFAASTVLYDAQVGVTGTAARLPTEVAGRYRATADGVELELAGGRTVRLTASAGEVRGPLAALPEAALDTLGVAAYVAR